VYQGPGSFLEAEKILPMLTSSTEGQPSFHVVAPNLPNFGFSEGVSKKGFGPEKYAEVRLPFTSRAVDLEESFTLISA
jgi:hypothetical protein